MVNANSQAGYAYVKLDNLAEGSYISAEESPSEPGL